MQEKIYGDFTKASATVLESLKELGEINTRFVDKLAKQQIEVLNKYVAEGPSQVKTLSEAKGYKDLLTTQSTLIKQYNEEFMGLLRQTTKIMSDAKDEYSAWVEKGVAAVAPMAKATKKVA